jgi:hypothetical protein
MTDWIDNGPVLVFTIPHKAVGMSAPRTTRRSILLSHVLRKQDCCPKVCLSAASLNSGKSKDGKRGMNGRRLAMGLGLGMWGRQGSEPAFQESVLPMTSSICGLSKPP